MAVVFLAQDLVLERQVAIKVLPPDMSFDTKLIPRFQQEAKTAAKLDHPNIIPIYRVESEAGLDYFVMKYVTGHSLEQVLEQGPLPIDLARRVLREAALALGHAHKRGIVHRDVKPANIMLESDGRVVLTDFGISKALEGRIGLYRDRSDHRHPALHGPGAGQGVSTVDGRADQYSLAVVGHQMLTGKQPFEGSSHSILYKHVFEPPPRVFETRPDAPADLVAALDRALAKDPEQRFATMEDFAAALSGDRRSGSRTMVSTPLNRVTRRSRLVVRLTRSRFVRRGLVAIGVCLALGGAAWASLREPAKSPGLTSVTPAPAVAPASQGGSISPANQPKPATTVTTQPMDTSRAPPSRTTEVTPAAAKPKPARKEFAYLTVASEPWAMLYLDDVEIGPTPVADHPLSPGRYRLRIEQEGYRSKTETIVVTGPNPIRRRYSLEPAGVE